MAASARELLESLFRTAVAAAHPSQCLPPNLPEPPPRGRLIVLAAGKAAGSMTQAAEQHYLGRDRRRTGSPASPSPATATAARPGIFPWSRPAIRCRTKQD